MKENIYICNLCGYTSKYTQGKYQHIKTKRHSRNLELFQIKNSTKNSTTNYNLLSSINEIGYSSNLNTINDNIIMIEPERTQNEPERTQNEPKMNPKESKNHSKEYTCKYCYKCFTTNSHMNRHINKKRCKIYSKIIEQSIDTNYQNNESEIKIQNYNKMEKDNLDILNKVVVIKEELDKAIEKISSYENKMIISNNTNSNNTYYNNIDTMNMNNINNLNLNFGNVIPMETFLYNMEHVNKIPEEDIDNLLYISRHMGIDDIANCFEKIISKNCIEQTKNMVTDNGLKMLPTIPVLCTDGSMRSHKERLLESWDTIYNDKHFSKMWDIVNKRVYELKNEYIYISNKHKKKIYSRIKKKVTVEDLCCQNK